MCIYYIMFPSLLQEFDKYLYNEFTRPRTGDLQSLQSRTVKTVQQKEDERIKREFEEYERSHFVVDDEVYLSMLGCVEAYKKPSERKPFLENRTIYQEQVSTDRMAVYVRGLYSIKSLYICIHGTKLTSLEDIIQDAQVIENSILNSPFTINYIGQIIRIRDQFPHIPDDNIYISGHSLGSIYALLGSKILNTNGYGFNGASALLNIQLLSSSIDLMSTRYDLNNLENYDNFTAYRIAGDPISLLSKWTLKNVVNIDVVGVSDLTPIQKHSMDTFLKFCIPLVPLDTSGLSRARRFTKLDDSRDQVPREGQEFDILRQQTETTPLGELLKIIENSGN